ncbi:Pre-rRNA-processing protein TSR2-domain-containing protein [Pisolithus croceorrhizus]|nr:Pre-rRNA-processing protein TSR2-domain-containing protein [Pisolithus croceorrhizus]
MSSPSPVLVLFARGILARLAVWSALRIAVKNGWGGPESSEKQRWLAGIIVDQYEDHIPPTDMSTSQSQFIGIPPDASYIEEMLLQIMVDEFEVVLEDNSAYEVARDVVRLWEDVCSGRDALVKEWEGQAGRYVPPAEEGEGDLEDSSDDESDDSDVDMDEDVPQLLDHSRHRPRVDEPEVDEEGFTTVRRQGRR